MWKNCIPLCHLAFSQTSGEEQLIKKGKMRVVSALGQRNNSDGSLPVSVWMEASGNGGTHVSDVVGAKLHFVNGGENILQSYAA